MKSDVNHVYILTPAELTVIAAAKNIQGMFSMQNTDDMIDEAVVCHALNHLFQKEFIHNTDGEGFVLEDGLRRLVEGIQEAKSVILIRRFTENANMKVIYTGERLVAVEQRLYDMSAVRLYEIPQGQIEDFLQEYLQMEDSTLRKVLDEDRLIQEGIRKKHVLQDNEAEGMGNIVTMVEKVIPTNKIVTCRMIAKQENQWIQYEQSRKEIELLGEQEFFDYIVNMIKGELDDIS